MNLSKVGKQYFTVIIMNDFVVVSLRFLLKLESFTTTYSYHNFLNWHYIYKKKKKMNTVVFNFQWLQCGHCRMAKRPKFKILVWELQPGVDIHITYLTSALVCTLYSRYFMDVHKRETTVNWWHHVSAHPTILRCWIWDIEPVYF